MYDIEHNLRRIVIYKEYVKAPNLTIEDSIESLHGWYNVVQCCIMSDLQLIGTLVYDQGY